MVLEKLVKQWFEAWDTGELENLPISEAFEHHSPFGIIAGKKAYLDLVEKNRSKFLGYSFEIVDAIYETHKACVRYVAKQGEGFKLDVSEWYYEKDGLFEKVIAYYHIGEIIEDRKLDN